MPQSSPYPYLFLSQLHKQFSICSGWHTHGFQSCHPFARALSFRIWGICPQLLCTSPGKHAVLLWITVKSRKAHVPRKRLLYTSFREAKVNSVSIPRQTSVFQASPMNLCLVWQVPAIPSPISFSRCPHSTISFLLAPFPQPAWLPPYSFCHLRMAEFSERQK